MFSRDSRLLLATLLLTVSVAVAGLFGLPQSVLAQQNGQFGFNFQEQQNGQFGLGFAAGFQRQDGPLAAFQGQQNGQFGFQNGGNVPFAGFNRERNGQIGNQGQQVQLADFQFAFMRQQQFAQAQLGATQMFMRRRQPVGGFSGPMGQFGFQGEQNGQFGFQGQQ